MSAMNAVAADALAAVAPAIIRPRNSQARLGAQYISR